MYNPLTEEWSKSHSYAADDWFTNKQGEYIFKPEELQEAHEDCQARVMGAMMDSVDNIIVTHLHNFGKPNRTLNYASNMDTLLWY